MSNIVKMIFGLFKTTDSSNIDTFEIKMVNSGDKESLLKTKSVDLVIQTVSGEIVKEFKFEGVDYTSNLVGIEQLLKRKGFKFKVHSQWDRLFIFKSEKGLKKTISVRILKGLLPSEGEIKLPTVVRPFYYVKKGKVFWC